MPQQNAIQTLFTKWVQGTASAEEELELERLLTGEDSEAALAGPMSELWMNIESDPLVTEEQSVELAETVLRRTNFRRPPKQYHRVHFLKTSWFRYAAAILIIAGIGAYLWNTQQKEKPQITQTNPAPVKNDILPGKDRAILTLSDGKKIELNNATSEIISDGTLFIKNSNGQLLYSDAERGSLSPAGGSGAAGAEGGPRTATNTMSTPRGGQYKLTLSDGTRVWLNAASSITYPVTFTGKTREVSVTGEGYFEVARNPKQPFYVKTLKDQIAVLGTSFNVNAYEDEPGKTSLIEGSVSISSAGGGGSLPAGRQGAEARTATWHNVILKPGQAFSNGKVITTNLAHDLAWKNGLFSFHEADMQTVMRDLARWYDLEVTYEGKIPGRKFNGEIGRQLTLTQVLKGLSKTGINYRIENGNRLVIMP